MSTSSSLTLGILTVLAVAAGAPRAPAEELLTRAELSGFTETARYEETLALCRRLESASPWIRVTSFGKSPEGRELILVIASRERAFNPAAAAKTGKPVVLIQSGIHAGEIDGKDAGLMLLRDIAVSRRRDKLLDRCIVLFMPIYNVDGHELFGPYNRINQNGPREQGWRTTSRRLNLNRDYLKADAVETRAWLKLFTRWWPDLTIDCHVTDGADFRYDVTYGYEAGPNTPVPIARWIDSALKTRVAPSLEAGGHVISPYIFLKDDTDPTAGLGDAGISPPRFSTGYTVLQNRPSFLIETHMLKDYRSRVLATYDTLVALLEAVNGDAASLRQAVVESDSLAARPGRVVLQAGPAAKTERVVFKGVEYRREPSEVSGGMRVVYGSGPLDLEMQRPVGYEETLAVQKPLAYIVPAPWSEVIERLAAHGLKMSRLRTPATVVVDSYRLTEPKWQETPFEGRHPVAFTTTRLREESRWFPAGSAVVWLDQRSSAVAVGLLEPQAADSLAGWGFFDAIFEQKEFAEAYVLEKLAREMMRDDPALRVEFEKALAEPGFAASPAKRLEFFYRRSPWWDRRIGVYPVGSLTTRQELDTEPMP